jgi:diguanylate cyclase (GGDEF)-like protein
VVLLENLQKGEHAAAVVQKLRDALQTPMNICGHQLRISPSIGIAIYPQDGQDLQALLKHADQAMYAEKRSG